jgi:transcription-repair coupling factor (superfamily II helicase)
MFPGIKTKSFDIKGGRFLGLRGPARAWFISVASRRHQSLLVVCKDRSDAEDLEIDLRFFIHDRPVVLLTPWDTLPFEQVSPQISVQASRLYALHLLGSKTPHIVVATPDALTQKILSPELSAPLTFNLSSTSPLRHKDLATKLEWAGYQHVSLVEDIGELAVRGEVIDFFPPGVSRPIRVQYLAGSQEEPQPQIELKYFDPDTQRTLEQVSSIEVIPVRELLPLHANPNLHQEMLAGIERIKARGKALEVPPREVAKHMLALRHGTPLPGIEVIQGLAIIDKVSVCDLLSSDTRLILCDPLGIEQAIDSFDELLIERENKIKDEHLLLPSRADLYLTVDEVLGIFKSLQPASLDLLELQDGDSDAAVHRFQTASLAELATRLRSAIGSGNALEPLRREINRLRNADTHIACIVGSRGRAERLHRILLEQNLDAQITDQSVLDWIDSPRRYPLVIITGHISCGVHLPGERIAFISENEIFGERSYRTGRMARTNVKKLLSSLAQLKEGDFVVHADYGIGIYNGLKHLEVGDSEGDFLQIDYADSRLYLPVQNINKIQKFSAAEGQLPVIDKLSSTRWLRTRQKVKDSVITLAGDLIKLYATRSVSKGWRFEPQGAEDERFADGFAYNETPDQLKAIEETLLDMASDRPMDRLICGDVGFGKTEVAIRAAFKCVQHTRQVAVLAPTTILVEQHRKNFEERFKGYNIKVGAISRFYSPQSNKDTLAQLASGELDIVIGTQRLLQRDIVFKDLGLLIIDEEHRFGVAQKEKLKLLRKNVDVMTLTATPIPRTLHMSLLDLRDISLIATPPNDRKLIRTYVAEANDSLIRDAILRELQRGGQSFYLHNRVESIAGVTARLQELVPEARFGFAHGQMSEDELEPIIRSFIQKEIDVLVSTTIIESGIDIPNANTIIIERADALGLAQLYQLRGRVGRSSRQAYAYLMIPSARKLTADAQKRLKVLQSLDDLGLGFNLAINDLEIRGAGNLLGKEQSGNVLSVGFDLYTRILKEAIANLKGEELPLDETIDPEVKLGINAFVPDSYIPDISERLVLYQRLAAITDPGEADDLRDEIEDRFGPLPREVKNLVELMRLRALFRHFGVFKGEFGSGKLLLSFSPQAKVDIQKVLALVRSDPTKYRFGKNLTLSVCFDFETLESPLQLFRPTEKILRDISQDSDGSKGPANMHS